MAKWGEGDPRWIVEDRADGTNVNNWHWTEKNATAWSQKKLKGLLEGLKIEDGPYSCEVKEITKIEGEAVANNRKAKLIFFYEWQIKADWKGQLAGGEKTHKGKLEILNLSEEIEPKDVDIEVTANSDKDEAYKVKEFMRIKGSEKIRELLEQYICDLKKEYSQGMVLPKKTDTDSSPVAEKVKNVAKAELAKPVTLSSNKDKSSGVKIPCKKITDKHIFKCRASEIFRALTEKDMVEAFTRNPATIRAEKGERFALFDGNVTGHFTCVKPYERLEMEWRYKSWPVGHHSSVRLEFEEKSDCTEMRLTQTGVPEGDLDRTKEGWARYYWQSINQTFGFGVNLL